MCVRSGSAWILESVLSRQWECMFTRWGWRLTSNCPTATRRWGVIEVKSMQLCVRLCVCMCVCVCVCVFAACSHILSMCPPVKARPLLSLNLASCHPTWGWVTKASIDFQWTDGKHSKKRTEQKFRLFAGILGMFRFVCVSRFNPSCPRSDFHALLTSNNLNAGYVHGQDAIWAGCHPPCW